MNLPKLRGRFSFRWTNSFATSRSRISSVLTLWVCNKAKTSSFLIFLSASFVTLALCCHWWLTFRLSVRSPIDYLYGRKSSDLSLIQRKSQTFSSVFGIQLFYHGHLILFSFQGNHSIALTMRYNCRWLFGNRLLSESTLLHRIYS